MDSYDEIPYHSAPFTETHPSNLAAIGRLFGLETPDPEACRVVELGCASGGNLIPMAWHLPGSTFEGVELSAGQASAGAALAAELGLANLRIRQGDILDLGGELGEVDYLIVHGVYSWVPAPVQARILEICQAHLSASGVAYVSYNTLPGWRMRGMLRDALLYHVRDRATPVERLAGARELLDRLDGALEGLDALSARYLRQEIAYLRRAHPSYLYHEYLESLNEPVLFTEFVRRAATHGLQYLADTDLQTMFPTTLTAGAQALVADMDSQVEQEQYLDFVRNRSFRQTLLCRSERRVNRSLDLAALDAFSVFSSLEPPRKPDLRVTRPVAFRRADGPSFEVRHPLTKAALGVLAPLYPDSMPLPELRARAERRVLEAGNHTHAGQHDHLAAELFSLFANGAVGLDVRPRAFARAAPAARPRASDLARAQAARRLGYLATARHGTLALDAFAERLVGYLDGTLDLPGLARHLAEEIQAGRLPVDGPAAHGDRLLTQVRSNCERLLALFARHGVLAA